MHLIAESWIRFLLMEVGEIGLPIKKCLAGSLAKNSSSVAAFILPLCNIYYKCCAADGVMQ